MDRKNIVNFEQLWDHHSREIFNYLWRMLRDSQDAEDAFQETFIRAFRGFPRLTENSHLKAWIYKIATNVAYTQLKRANRFLSRTADDIEILQIAVFDNLETREFLAAVVHAIEQLPHKQQASLVLRKYQGLTYEEISRTLDCSPESARANVYQAIKKLRTQFAEAEEL